MIKRVDENGLVHLVTNIRKPRKWRRYEYIQGASGCKIDTRQHGHMNFTYEVKFLAVNGIAALVWYVQDGDTYYKLALSLTFGTSSGNRFWMTYWSSSNTNSNIGFTNLDSNIHVAKVSNGLWYWDGVSKGRTGQHSDSFVTTNTISILPNNYNKIYYFKIWDNTDTLLHEYVPAQYNGQYGMWDLVEDKFYGNSGTGTFTVGPEIKNYDEIYEVRRTGSILPAGVELYDYILSSGTLWIDTGVLYDSTKTSYKVEIRFSMYALKGTYDGVFGAYKSESHKTLRIIRGNSNSKLWYYYNTKAGGGNRNETTTPNSDIYEVTMTSTNTIVNDITQGTSNTYTLSPTSATNTATESFYLFDHANNSIPSKSKIWYFRLYDETILVRNMIPCTYLGEPGMWDTVENKFYRNQGTGLFTLGNKITLKEYEYLLSTGTQWIDTKYTVGPSNAPNIKLYVDVKATSTGVGSRWWVHGIGGGSSVGSLHVGIGNGSSGTTNLPFVYGNGRADITTTVKGDLGTRYKYTLDLKNQTYNITNESGTSLLSLSNITRGTAINTQDMTIYAWRRANTGAIGSSHSDDLYEYKLWDNDILVRHMIPVSYNGTPGLWDKVEWKFYANAGRGSFTLGPEKASGIYPVWTPIEYLESTGTLYIDTGVKADLYPFKLDILFMNHTSSGEKDVWGNVNSSLGDKYGFVSGVSGLNFFQWGGSPWSKAGATVNQWHIVTYEYPDANNRNMIADGTSYTVALSNNNIILSNSNIYLFSNGPRGRMKFDGKIKYAKIYINNTLVRDFIPVRIGNIGYLFDKVTGKMFGNSGTGNFILGPDI